MNEPKFGLLLDTHVLVWFVLGELSQELSDLLLDAAETEGLAVSPVSAWEIGSLVSDGRPHRPTFDGDAAAWYERALAQPGLREAPFTGAIALGSIRLPGSFHRDPADRLLVATARALDVPIVTRDEKILAYASAGHVKAIPC